MRVFIFFTIKMQTSFEQLAGTLKYVVGDANENAVSLKEVEGVRIALEDQIKQEEKLKRSVTALQGAPDASELNKYATLLDEEKKKLETAVTTLKDLITQNNESTSTLQKNEESKIRALEKLRLEMASVESALQGIFAFERDNARSVPPQLEQVIAKLNAAKKK